MQTGMYMGLGVPMCPQEKPAKGPASPVPQPSMSETPAESHVGLLVSLGRNFRVGKGWEVGEVLSLSVHRLGDNEYFEF